MIVRNVRGICRGRFFFSRVNLPYWLSAFVAVGLHTYRSAPARSVVYFRGYDVFVALRSSQRAFHGELYVYMHPSATVSG